MVADIDTTCEVGDAPWPNRSAIPTQTDIPAVLEMRRSAFAGVVPVTAGLPWNLAVAADEVMATQGEKISSCRFFPQHEQSGRVDVDIIAGMAKKTITTVTDDIDGSDGAKSVTFSLDGVAYSIDLAAKNQERLRAALQEFINHAARQRPTTKVVGKRTERGYDIAELRAWAAKKKIDLPARGRIPAAVVERYKATIGA